MVTVQCYLLKGNSDVPNSPLPVIHYRNVLPEPRNEDSATEFLTRNLWEKRVSSLVTSTRLKLMAFREHGVISASVTSTLTAMSVTVRLP